MTHPKLRAAILAQCDKALTKPFTAPFTDEQLTEFYTSLSDEQQLKMIGIMFTESWGFDVPRSFYEAPKHG